MSLKLHYDTEFDILYLSEKGIEDEGVEIYPGVTIELNSIGSPIGIEVIGASLILGYAIEPLKKMDGYDHTPLLWNCAMLEELLQTDGAGGYREYFLPPNGHAGAKALANIRGVFEPIWAQLAKHHSIRSVMNPPESGP
jgi:uncharacterized protein YuzE